ncbi:sulfite exporter TauE/SafE family protein [Vulcanisaeta distributa]|uniref:Probable membrane transporter protein n=1 Tax=Vulcanisaeta distributa (strain DSM 14429 / JCM 11212 / NBRC 100878 / IC-017) TaxID=572478 RepID=E1QPF4_VULDI|nr:sulfite exporter TauE/SafE family protein [Vulcanisaeta distributa]ADN51442.1 protein of unknown function DUF81 [Vulcanisaeta distributa DSM 14429]
MLSIYPLLIGTLLYIGASVMQWNFIMLCIIMFGICIIIGFLAALTGVGGAVIFTPIMMAFTSINTDVIRTTGLAIATVGSLIASRQYLGKGLANFNAIILTAIPYTISAIVGAVLGLEITRSFGNVGAAVIRLGLAILMLFIIGLFLWKGKQVDIPNPTNKNDKIAEIFQLVNARYYEESLKTVITYRAANTVWGLLCFIGVGLVSGMFGVGAGWAIVPVYNLVMYLPLKVAAATSKVLIAIGDTGALWVYINSGALVFPFLVPCVVGMVLGTEIGVRVMPKAKIPIIRWVIIAVMLVTSARLFQQSIPILMGWSA